MSYDSSLKRVVDLLIAVPAVIVLGPGMVATAAAIRAEDGGTPLFRQERVGKDGRRFILTKFRSMPVNTRNVPSAAAGPLTTTRVGRFIRRTNIDELPQLFNVLRGEMSIVGPRPALASQRELLELRCRNGAAACKPGLTGLAQVNAYDGMRDEEKAHWDGRYATTVSLSTDLRVILQTFRYLTKPPPVY